MAERRERTPMPAYREGQVFTLLWLLLPLTNVATGLAMLATGDPGAATGVLVLLTVSAVVLMLFGRLVIEVDDDALRWRFGFVGWPRGALPLAEIERIESLRSAGRAGAGIKGPARDRLISATIGGPALRLHLRGGRRLTIGTLEPDRLGGFIDARLPMRR